MRICYSFPSRSRKDRFFKALENIQDMSMSDNYFVIAKLDTDDETMNNDAVKDALHWFPEVTVKWGTSKSKVDAVNRGLEDLPPCDIIIIMSDDIVWDSFGFDDDIRDAFKKYFPKLDGTVHFPEDHGKHNTIIVSMLGINLFKQLGYLYYPKYISVYPDNDFTEMTKKMGKYAFVNKRLFTHAHPIWNLAEWDEQYRASESADVYKKDREVFNKRKANNFGV